MSAVELLARCIESGAKSGNAIKVSQPEEPTPKEAANSLDYMGSDDQEIGETEEEREVKVDWREGYEVAILRLLPLMADANDTMRRQVIEFMYSGAEEERAGKCVCARTNSQCLHVCAGTSLSFPPPLPLPLPLSLPLSLPLPLPLPRPLPLPLPLPLRSSFHFLFLSLSVSLPVKAP